MPKESDCGTDLMLEFQKGDESSFEKLVEKYQQSVFNFVYRFMGGREDAEDITQEIFIRVYSARESYKPKAKFTTWLYTICRNTCIKALNKKKIETLPILHENALSEEQAGISGMSSPEKAALQNERAQIVKKAIDALPGTQRMALILRTYEDLSYEEISQVMKCSEKAVKSLLYRAKDNLKEKLRPHLENIDKNSETY
jgi:RNA polymerase sigma-70 factor (ECF subfamily)